MNLEKINQMKDAIEKQMGEAIENSNLDLSEFFANQALVGKALKFEITLDLDIVRDEDIIQDNELRDSLRELPGSKLVLNANCWCYKQNRFINCSFINPTIC